MQTAIRYNIILHSGTYMYIHVKREMCYFIHNSVLLLTYIEKKDGIAA